MLKLRIGQLHQDIIMQPGESIAQALLRKDYKVPMACGGNGTCGKCKVEIDGAWVKSNGAWEFARMYDTVKRLQPSCQMAVNTCIRCGRTPDQYQGGEEIYYFPSDFRLHDPMFTRCGADADPKVYRRE